jgi:hypothetical protein
MSGKSLKDQNRTNLVLFLAWNIVILISTFSLSLKIDASKGIVEAVLSEKGLFMVFSPIILVILNGLLSSNFKVFIVFWKWKYGLPGHRAFSKLVYLDPRIDINNLKSKYGGFPIDPIEQNNLWYKILQKQNEDIVVNDSHKVYLLTRDMTSIAFIFLLSIPVLLFNNIEIKLKILTSAYFILQYLILIMVTRNYANRFTCNVLARDSQ